MQKDLYFTGNDDSQKVNAWKEALKISEKRWKDLDLSQSALLVIDMQRYFLDEQSHAFVPTAPEVVPNIQELIGLYRSNGRPVVYTYFAVEKGEKDPIGDWWGRTVSEGSKESFIINELKPAVHEKVFRKPSYSSFYKTELEKFLKDLNVHNVVITGVLTNLCCETTAREAFSRGFDVFVTMDATASFNEEMHLQSLKSLSYGCATPVATQDLLSVCAVA